MRIIDAITFFNEFKKYKEKINLINMDLNVKNLSFSKIDSIKLDLDLGNLLRAKRLFVFRNKKLFNQ